MSAAQSAATSNFRKLLSGVPTLSPIIVVAFTLTDLVRAVKKKKLSLSTSSHQNPEEAVPPWDSFGAGE